MKSIVHHIQLLVNTRMHTNVLRGPELSLLPTIADAYLVIENGKILRYGPMQELSKEEQADEWIDAKGATVLPAWCDSHTHLVFAETREEEFVDKIKGLSYEAIAAKGGGILNSARKLANCSEDELFERAMIRLQSLMHLGTGAIEVKSGYGLNTEQELKMLRVIQRIKAVAPIPVKASFLGAHTFPLGRSQS